MPPLSSELLSFLAEAQRCADPRAALRPHLQLLKSPTHLLAFGKASLEMADEALLSFTPTRGIVTCVPERLDSLPPDRLAAFEAANIELFPADHPLATERNLEAAAAVRDFVSTLDPTSYLLVLISGGGSAHLTLPSADLSLQNLRDVTLAIQRAGLSINQLNAVRKHCEQLKGGRLAAICPAENITCLILSDVLGDALDVISSGPFAPDPTTFKDAFATLSAGNITAPRIAAHLDRGLRTEIPETPKPGSPVFNKVRSTIIASNAQLVESLATYAMSRGVTVAEKWANLHIDAQQLAKRFADSIRAAAPACTPRAFIAGGEWTVNASSSSGVGGPSQELALALAIALAGTNAAALTYSTDGIDGPTNAAGAIVTGETFSAAKAAALDPATALANHDSATFFATINGNGANHLTPGPTGTNLNHIAVVLLDPVT